MSTISVQEIEQNPLAFLVHIEAGEALMVVNGERALAEVRPLGEGKQSAATLWVMRGRIYRS